MISLTDNRVALINLGTTIKAIEDLDTLIAAYSVDKPGPAYVEFYYIDGPGEIKMQLARPIALAAVTAQREKLVEYMATLGIAV